jgi:peptidoglycan endopeptidase LytE
LKRSNIRRSHRSNRQLVGRRWLGALTGLCMTTAVGVGSAFAATTYTVKPGDTAWSIARSHGITVQQLASLNGLRNPSLIFPNQVLRLSTAAHVTTSTYVVKPGDSLWSIAKRLHVTVAQLTAWNHISNPSRIYPGTVLHLYASTGTSSHVTVNVSTKPATSAPASRGGLPPVSITERVSGQAVVNYASHFIGAPYAYGGTSASGFDCSGLVQTVYKHFGINLPRMAQDQAQVGRTISVSSLQPGDLVFFNTTGQPYSHVGIWAGDGQFISATVHGGVCYQALNNPYWQPKLMKATRVLG